MKNILVKSYSTGKLCHANTISNPKGQDYIEVTPLDEPDNKHTCNNAVFHWEYEVIDRVD